MYICDKFFKRMINNNEIIYSSTVIDFVTVGVEFCSLLENEKPMKRNEWMDTALKILPLLYVKASLLPATVEMNDQPPHTFVKEEDYNRIVYNVSSIMGEEDVYLDVYKEEMKYSDRPISSFISEDIADIYQDIRNLVSVYQFELEDQMNDALLICSQNFKTYWGQKLVNVIRPLHALLYKENDDNDDTFETDINMEELWG